MKIRIVGCDGGMAPGKLTTCFQVTESLLIDAGSCASGLDLNEQKKIRHIFLTHIHIDHIKDLAFLSDNMLGEVETIQIHALAEVNRALRKHYFNGQLWPDFTKIPNSQNPFYQLVDIKPEKEYEFGDFKIQAVAVNHTVPAVGFILTEGEVSVVISGDTGPTERIWEISRDLKNVGGFIVEVAFPTSQQKVADGAKHLTPTTLKAELAKFERDNVPIGLYHLKPRFVEEMQKEIRAFGNPSLKFLRNSEVLQF
jgi:ribonuclease BN (tRNA processing enzyme)